MQLRAGQASVDSQSLFRTNSFLIFALYSLFYFFDDSTTFCFLEVALILDLPVPPCCNTKPDLLLFPKSIQMVLKSRVTRLSKIDHVNVQHLRQCMEVRRAVRYA